jgi:diamine N-acetyltransferase
MNAMQRTLRHAGRLREQPATACRPRARNAALGAPAPLADVVPPSWQHRGMDIVLRDATAEDALVIGVLGTQVFLDTYATRGIRPLLAREVREHFSTDAVAALLARPHTRFVLAESVGHLIGFVQLGLGERQALVAAEPAAELQRLYVQARFNGLGVGKALAGAAAAHAAAWGAQALWLTAWVGNQHALGWYRRQGWRELGSTDYVFEDERFENRVFSRALNPTLAPP